MRNRGPEGECWLSSLSLWEPFRGPGGQNHGRLLWLHVACGLWGSSDDGGISTTSTSRVSQSERFTELQMGPDIDVDTWNSYICRWYKREESGKSKENFSPPRPANQGPGVPEYPHRSPRYCKLLRSNRKEAAARTATESFSGHVRRSTHH